MMRLLCALLAVCMTAPVTGEKNGIGRFDCVDGAVTSVTEERNNIGRFDCADGAVTSVTESENYIRWVDCAADAASMRSALALCRDCHGRGADVAFSDIIAYVAYKNGNRFGKKDAAHFRSLSEKLSRGMTVDEAAGNNKYYLYHKEAYAAVFGPMVGVEEGRTGSSVEIKGRFPLAAGYWYSHYDDFGNSRSYGYKRRQRGHDIMGSAGTPVVAVEGGTVTEIGWNKYGGWRIGIRSDDGLRYWYYAHLRRDNPYARGIDKGARVTAGQHIGYLGRTGYSATENTDLKTGATHLHIGLQLIFHPSQGKGSKEIWVDLYGITGFLSAKRVKVPSGLPDRQIL